MDEEIFELHADVCRTLSNPKRLKILNALRVRGNAVSRILAKMGSHRQGQPLPAPGGDAPEGSGEAARREGNIIRYRISSPKIIQACDLMREVLFEQLEGKGPSLAEPTAATGAAMPFCKSHTVVMDGPLSDAVLYASVK